MPEVRTCCPHCRKVYQVPENRLGEQARCKNCSKTFTLEMAAEETFAPRPAESKPSGQPNPPSVPQATPLPAKPKTPPAGGSELQPNPAAGESEQPERIGPYIVRRRLGAGGMGVVWLAHDPGLDRDVAVKVLPPEWAKDAVYLKRFLREARAAAKLNHPNTVTIYQVAADGPLVYLAMELVEGVSLDEAVEPGRPMPWREAARAIRDAAAGLAAAHEIGLVHRDIKPANLMRTAKGVTKVVDFGLARGLAVDSQLTQQGVLLGTPLYMAPEQWMGKEADARADLYSLVCTYYYLLTGQPPYEAPSAPSLGYQHRYEPFPDPRQRVPDLPQAVCRVLARGAEKDPADRYQTAVELIAALDELSARSDELLAYEDILETPAAPSVSPQAPVADSSPKRQRGAQPSSPAVPPNSVARPDSKQAQGTTVPAKPQTEKRLPIADRRRP
jgi:urea transport system substrate-binding protein